MLFYGLVVGGVCEVAGALSDEEGFDDLFDFVAFFF